MFNILSLKHIRACCDQKVRQHRWRRKVAVRCIAHKQSSKFPQECDKSEKEMKGKQEWSQYQENVSLTETMTSAIIGAQTSVAMKVSYRKMVARKNLQLLQEELQVSGSIISPTVTRLRVVASVKPCYARFHHLLYTLPRSTVGSLTSITPATFAIHSESSSVSFNWL